jgi:hypothetical protein
MGFVASVWAIVAKLQALDSRDRGASCLGIYAGDPSVSKSTRRDDIMSDSLRETGIALDRSPLPFCTWGPNVGLGLGLPSRAKTIQ